MASHHLEGEPAFSAGRFLVCTSVCSGEKLVAVTLQRYYAD
jgi:hypothetical protein